MKHIVFVILCLLWSGSVGAQTENTWSSQDYDFYAGDFNGDGYTDILFIGRDPSLPSGIILSDGTSPSILGQTWASNYLGIPWSSGAYSVVVGDFNGDGKTDILLQSNGPGDSYLLLTDATGTVTAISQTIPAQAMGLGWTGDQHHLVAGNFTGSGKASLYFQPVDASGVSAIVVTDQNGQFTAAQPLQTWGDGFLGLAWAVDEANVYAGDFNGDGQSDLLVQAIPSTVGGSGGVAISEANNGNGVALSQGGSQPFVVGSVQTWNRNGFGVDWSPFNNQLVIADFSGDGRADVLFQPLDPSGSANLLLGNSPGPIFVASSGPIPSDLPISVQDAVLIAGSFDGGKAAGLLIQASSLSGSNSIAKNITGGIHPRQLNFPVLSSASVVVASVGGMPPPSRAASSGVQTGSVASAATVAPTSAGRTAAQFSVSATGAATYNIPIWTPPGARGLEPHLALRYTSGGPDGPIGPGWSVSGVSAIVRCAKTWASNAGAPAPVTLSTTDDVCVDGNRLRQTSGSASNPLTSGSTYQGELADFSVFTAYGTSGQQPQYFIAQGKDGRYYEYGNTSDSRISASGAAQPYAWALSKVRDRDGNTMVFTYTTGATTVTLASIKYTATPGTSNPAPYEVDFNYVARSGGTTISKYVSGSVVSRTTQLDNINVLSSGTSVRKYQLGYGASPTTNRPLLQTLQECGGSASTDCIRPTTISYQPGAATWGTTSTYTGLSGTYGFIPLDLNGDGIPDVIYGKLSGTNIHWYARIATTSGYGAELDTGANTSTTGGSQTLIVGNLNGSGKAQFLAPVGSTLYVYSYNGSGFTSASTGAPSGISQYVADWDGDGLPDLVEYSPTGNTITVRRNTSSGGTVSFATSVQTVFTAISGDILVLTNPALGVDFNGDGRSDMLVRTFHTGPHQTSVFSDYTVLSNGFSSAPTQINLNAAIDNASENNGAATVLVGDWNGDGCTDVVTPKAVFLSNCAGTFTSFSLNIPFFLNAPYPYPIQLVDVDGDGQMDLVYPDPTTANLFVARSTGTGIATGVNTSIPYVTQKAFSPIDRDSDGLQDLIYVDSSNGGAVSYYLHGAPGTPADLATTFSDGFGINFSPVYAPITQGYYTKYATASFPEIDIDEPTYVVTQFSAADGRGSTYTNDFYYYGARLQLQGRGFEGFYGVRQHDSRNGTYQYSYYNQTFPKTGTLFEQDSLQSDNVTYLASTRNNWQTLSPGGLSGTTCTGCYFAYIQEGKVYSYESTGGKGGGFASAIANTDTLYTYDVYGNLTDTTATTTDTDTGAPASPFHGQAWITEIKNSISNDNSSANWCLGRPYNTTTTKTAAGQPALTRTVAHTIDYAKCRATVETLEPNDSRLKVTTSFGFDACGNTNSVSVVGLDETGSSMTARPTGTNWGTFCIFAEQMTNALGQVTKTSYNYSYGLPASITDPNNIQTVAYQYDNFGRKLRETHADATYTSYGYVDCVSATCWGLPDLRMLVEAWNWTTDGSQNGTEYKYYDGLDRQRYDEAFRVTGVWTVAIVQYDSLGRKSTAYVPYSGCCNNGYHNYSYDVQNRQTQDALYTPSGTLYRTIGILYEGTTVQVTDPNGHTVTKVTDVASKMRQVTDDSSGATVAGTTYYTFDSFGNLTKIVDADTYASTFGYNIRGFKTSSSDVDGGGWTFTPDSLNELKIQVDAKSQTTSFGYDLLGRMTSRLEPEHATPTQWTYGTSATNHEIGHVIGVSKPETPNPYSEAYTYDSAGRVQTATYTEDAAAYQFTYGYNTWGKVDTITYPVSTSGYQFVLKNVYDNWGYLSAVKDNAAGTVFWSLGAANDSSLPVAETLGNGVSVGSTYNTYTNEIGSRTEGTGGQTSNVQNLIYQWDLAGNLHDRQDQIQGLTEQFSYDSMNRLLGSTLNGVTNLSMTYDAAGNILTKSDVSASQYGYDSVHKHAVKTAGSWSMSYDANGNMVTRAGGSVTWKSYNLPDTINFGSNSTEFWYDGNHQRWKQVANYSGTTETTHYIGGLLQVLTRGSGATEYRHQIPAGTNTVVYTRRTDSTTSTYYATSDHLGSANLILDSAGNVLSTESFTPFGARRASNWSNQAPAQADYTVFGNTTRNGFTGHEMLDSVSLVHMNGRVYDPYLGRFISADSMIQNLAASQSVNPFSYAANDPLRYIDPSGHSLLGDIIGIIVAIVAIYFMQPEVLEEEASISTETALVAGFAGGFVGAYVSTGSLSAALTAGLISGLTAAAFAEVGSYASQLSDNGANAWTVKSFSIVAHAGVGCVSTAASGGNCGRGALAAGLTEAANQAHLIEPPGKSLGSWGTFRGTAEAGLVGGGVSALTGGKFTDGFSVSAAGYLFNSAGHAAATRHTYEVDLVAELPGADALAGHVFLGFSVDGQPIDALGYGLNDPNLAQRLAAALIPVPGALEDNMADYLNAQGGNANYAIYRISVSEEQFYKTYAAISSYGDTHSTYSTVGMVDCVHAAAYALLSSGVNVGTLNLQFVQSTAYILPQEVYHAIHLANGQPY